MLPSSGYDRSFVYRIKLDTLRIDRAYRVGPVPKVVAVTRDGAYVLVSNWCGYDVSVVSVRRGRRGPQHPHRPLPAGHRGVAGEGRRVRRGDGRLGDRPASTCGRGGRGAWRSARARGPWRSARPAASCSPRSTPRAGWPASTSTTGAVAKVSTGSAPRSLAIAPDGRAVYVVNYESGTVSKVRASDLRVLQTVPACYHPIGITYEPVTRRVWVACYGGQIRVYDDGARGS